MQYANENLAIIADDLTGACDTACQFALYGFQPIVVSCLEPNLSTFWRKGFQDGVSAPAHAGERVERCAYHQDSESALLVVNTDSRKADGRSAARTVAEIARTLRRGRCLLFYKKMDSTLKGNWAPELAAVVTVARPDLTVVAPAFPVWGRTTVEGFQCSQGKPLFESRPPGSTPGTGTDERESNLVDRLQTEFGKRVCLFRRPSLKKGPAATAKQMESARSRGYAFQVFDAIEDDDLKTIVLASCRLDCKLLWTGSAGLARYLPLGWGYSMTSKGAVPRPAVHRPTAAPVLVISGSFNPVNASQLECLLRSGLRLLWVEDEDSANSAQTRAKLDQACQALQAGIDVALSVRLNKPIRSADHMQRLQDALQFAALHCLQLRPLAGMVLVGGETAMKLYRRAGAAALRMDGEVHPGIPCGRWIGGLLDGQPLVTKAGGFGQADTLAKAVAFLKGESQPNGEAKARSEDREGQRGRENAAKEHG